jgi:hypothetical protein
VEKIFGKMPKYEAGPVVVFLTFSVCILSWHFFEKPVLGLKRFFWNAPLAKPVRPADAAELDEGVSKNFQSVRVY